jgi:hypothetical protein
MFHCPIGGSLSGTVHILQKKPWFTCFAPGWVWPNVTHIGFFNLEKLWSSSKQGFENQPS